MKGCNHIAKYIATENISYPQSNPFYFAKIMNLIGFLQVKKYREQSQFHERQQKDDKAKFDQEMSQMCATLEKYKVG